MSWRFERRQVPDSQLAARSSATIKLVSSPTTLDGRVLRPKQDELDGRRIIIIINHLELEWALRAGRRRSHERRLAADKRQL